MSFFNLYAPPLTTGDEKALLHTHLRLHREALLWKLEDLPEADLRRPMTGTGTNLLGLVKHLTGVEGAYFCDAFGKPRPPLAWESDEGVALGDMGDMYARVDESPDELIASIAPRPWPPTGRSRSSISTRSGVITSGSRCRCGG